MKIKKFIAILLGAMLCFALAACGEAPTKQEEQDPAFAKTKGTWRLDGEEGTAYIEMDGKGNFEAYYADGALEFAGYLEHVDEFEDGNGRYDMYDLSGELITSFYFHEETAFHIGGNYGDTIYIKE